MQFIAGIGNLILYLESIGGNKKEMIVRNKTIELENLGEGITRKILAHGGSLMLVEAYFREGKKGAVHSHTNEQITYVVNGLIELEIGGEKEMVSSGDSVYIEPRKPHGLRALKDSCVVDVFMPLREDLLK